jgi:hypothetical protein
VNRLGKIVATTILLFTLSASSVAQRTPQICPTADRADNWLVEARHHLRVRAAGGGLRPATEAELRAAGERSLCLRKNNYWCQKQIGQDFWQGSEGPGGCVGNRDDRRHAIFRNAPYGARAGAQAIRTSFVRGDRTAYAIAARRSPSCDTLGSWPLYPRDRPAVARSCGDPPRPPASWRGPSCPREARTEQQCVPGCNCPPRLARGALARLPVSGIDDPLPFFEASCAPMPALVSYLQEQAFTEIGFYPSEELIRAGFALMSPPRAGARCG